jgi:hypothetical protein
MRPVLSKVFDVKEHPTIGFKTSRKGVNNMARYK